MKRNYVTLIVFNFVLVLVVCAVILFLLHKPAPLTIHTSNGRIIDVYVTVADTEAERERGLMNATLAENEGMLFVFDRTEEASFWMKDTPTPLSVAFIAEDGTIVGIVDMEPFDETVHSSGEPIRYGLEVNQGFFEKNNVLVGDVVEIS